VRGSSMGANDDEMELGMGKLIVTEFMSLDGIVEDPAGEWVNQFDQGLLAPSSTPLR
jgi:hypothetical protein